jgi:hypothetical protein
VIFGIALLVVLYVVWLLFIDGWLWKLILLVAGWIGVRMLLLAYWPGSEQTAFIFQIHHVSWAAAIASGICVMALLTTKD